MSALKKMSDPLIWVWLFKYTVFRVDSPVNLFTIMFRGVHLCLQCLLALNLGLPLVWPGGQASVIMRMIWTLSVTALGTVAPIKCHIWGVGWVISSTFSYAQKKYGGAGCLGPKFGTFWNFMAMCQLKDPQYPLIE